MGLDRTAGALLIGQSDAPGDVRSRGDRGDAGGLRGGRRGRSASSPTTPTRARCSSQARRIVVPALEQRGSLLLEDVGVPIPLLPDLLGADRGDRRRRTTSRSRSSPTPATATPTR